MNKEQEIAALRQQLLQEMDKAEHYRKQLLAYQANYAAAMNTLQQAVEQFKKYEVK